MIVKNVEKKENNKLTFQVETDAAEFESAVQGAYLKSKSSINIPETSLFSINNSFIFIV